MLTNDELFSGRLLSPFSHEKDVEISLPNWNQGRYGGKFMLNQLRELCFGRKVISIIVFGSSVREPGHTVKRSSFLWWEWESRVDIDAKDIDLLVLVDGDGVAQRAVGQISVRADDGFYGYYWKPLDALHIAFLSPDEFEAMIRAKDQTAHAILAEGVVLCGEPPFRLNSGRKFE